MCVLNELIHALCLGVRDIVNTLQMTPIIVGAKSKLVTITAGHDSQVKALPETALGEGGLHSLVCTFYLLNFKEVEHLGAFPLTTDSYTQRGTISLERCDQSCRSATSQMSTSHVSKK